LSILSLGLSPGDPVPNFAAKNQEGKWVRLSDFKGKNVLIFFYPKDDTPGCTQEACNFRDEYTKIKALNTEVIGVSRQDDESHRAFRRKHKLPFDLLVDQDGSLAQSFGVDLMPVIGLAKRQSVLVGRDGKILKIYKDVNPRTHVKQVMEDLAKSR
jgi:peroxiredoxin Q/BCP